MSNEQTQAQLQEYEKVVEALDEMIVVIDRDYRYVLANRAFLDYRAQDREQVLGRFVEEVWGAEVFRDIKKNLDEAFRGNTIRAERKHVFPTRGERDIASFYFPLEGTTGFDRVACIVRDVTDLRESERDREKLFEALRTSNEQLQLLSQRLVEVQEEERKRVAHEIYDEISQTLTTLMNQLETTGSVTSPTIISMPASYRALSPREREILWLIAKGSTNKEIAEQLSLSVRTVERHRSSIMSKLGLRRRAELIAFAVRHGLLSG